jgi:hypothetical protein
MRVVHGLGSRWNKLWQRSCIACPDKDSALLIHRQAFGVNYFLFESFEIFVIQVETQLERAIGEALFTGEQIDDLRQDLRKFHVLLLRVRQRGLCWGCFITSVNATVVARRVGNASLPYPEHLQQWSA